MTAPVVKLYGRWGGRRRPQDVRLHSGDDATLQVTVIDDATGAAKDISSALATYKAFRRDSATAQITLTGTISTGTDGIITFALTDGDTANLAARDYAHEVQLTESGGAIGTVLVGTLRLARDLIE